MKKNSFLTLSIVSMLMLAGCSSSHNPLEEYGKTYDYNERITLDTPANITVQEATGNFEIVTSDGTYTKTNNIYKITKAGTYAVTGKLNGQILIEAGSSDDVVLELNGASINYGSDSPIKAVTCSKLEISAKSGSGNIVNDTRNAKTTDIDSQGEGAISADVDLKLKGTGTLVVNGNYNNGIHTTKDLTIQKLTVKTTGYNNAIKGKDSVTITSGTIQAYATKQCGIKTVDSDISSKGNQRGKITINGGSLYIDSLRDALDASFNAIIDELDNSAPTSVTLKTGTNSSFYNSSSFKEDSEKGIKAANEIIFNKGKVTIASSDDAIHANYGSNLDNGNKGVGNITVNDGIIKVLGGDDGLHADNVLTVNGGKIVVAEAKEGFEGNYINIYGGSTYIYGSNDGINCSKKTFRDCSFRMTGGLVDVAVEKGDTDGIDSNGDFTLSGGTLITRGSPGTRGSKMSTGLDVDGTLSMTGGTLIAFNGLEKSPSSNNSLKYAGTTAERIAGKGTSSSLTLSAGIYKLSGNEMDISFTNDYIYGSFLIFSSKLANNTTFTLSRSDSAVFSRKQSSNSVTIS